MESNEQRLLKQLEKNEKDSISGVKIAVKIAVKI